MSHLWPLLITAAILWLLFRFVRSQFRGREAPEAVEGPIPGNPLAGVPAPKKNPPRTRAGAIALEEPEGDQDHVVPPRFS